MFLISVLHKAVVNLKSLVLEVLFRIISSSNNREVIGRHKNITSKNKFWTLKRNISSFLFTHTKHKNYAIIDSY